MNAEGSKKRSSAPLVLVALSGLAALALIGEGLMILDLKRVNAAYETAIVEVGMEVVELQQQIDRRAEVEAELERLRSSSPSVEEPGK